jgi:nucleotidyltransferase/DNA polymerase involved in DNA repair
VSDAGADSATILHADLDSFYASVEQRDDPTLRGRPVIVGGGVVLAASYEAKARGVRTAMGERQALQLCPNTVVVPPRMSAYLQASDDVFEVFRDTTPLVEPVSIDEAFLDVSGLRRVSGEPVQIAARLREQIRDQVGLPITVGIARTKFLAKVASQEAKPDGLLLVPPGRELGFLHPLPVRRLWGVGAKTAEKLQSHGIDTVARRMRGANRTGRTVTLRLRFDDFSRATRSHTLPRAAGATGPILAAARELVAAAAPLVAERGLTLIGFAVSNIARDGAQQLELPFDARADLLAVDLAMDDVRSRYGNSALTRGVLVGRDPGLEMPHPPD